MATAYFDIGHLIPVAGNDLEYNGANPPAGPGQIGYMMDQLGTRYFKLCQNRAGSTLAQFSLASLAGNASGQTAEVTLTGGSTTTAVKAAGWTASKHEGAILYVSDNADSAGAAPEGEVAPIKTNIAGQINLDSDFPLTVALANNDKVIVQSNYQIEAAAADDIGRAVAGVIPGADGIGDTNFGWVQFFGKCRALIVAASTALVANDPVVAGAGRLEDYTANDLLTLYCGYAVALMSTDIVSDIGFVHVAVGDNSGMMNAVVQP